MFQRKSRHLENSQKISMEMTKARSLPSCTKLPLLRGAIEEVVEKSKDWATMHGMGYRPKDNIHKNLMQHAPFTLLPSTFPRVEFQTACEMQPILNTFIHKVAYDYDFLKETLAETVKVDDFTRRLFHIYDTVYREGFSQKISLGLLRSDLMLDTNCGDDSRPFCCWKQVEINTIASGMGGLGPLCTQFHEYVLTELDLGELLKHLPQNNALEGLNNGILQAWKIYNDPDSVILFIVEEFSLNICDQRLHEFDIRRRNPDVKVVRKTLTQLTNEAKLGPGKELIVGNKIVAVVYFRCGYSPEQYYTEREWDVRLLIERSLAIKCPSIQYHLAGTKKVQQALANPGTVARYLKNEKTAERVKKIFTGLYSLDDNRNNVLEMALENPERFVLKPQREGGGNNIYGSDIRSFLENITADECKAWILMDKINPPPQLNYFITASNPLDFNLHQVISELGIFGVIIGDENNIIVNKQVGHLLRTKKSTSNEGGLMSGTATCDSPFLID